MFWTQNVICSNPCSICPYCVILTHQDYCDKINSQMSCSLRWSGWWRSTSQQLCGGGRTFFQHIKAENMSIIFQKWPKFPLCPLYSLIELLMYLCSKGSNQQQAMIVQAMAWSRMTSSRYVFSCVAVTANVFTDRCHQHQVIARTINGCP